MRVAAAALLSIVVLAGTAGAVRAEDGCPEPVPVGELTAGLQGTGLTVVSGSEPVTFAVEVLGVLADGLAPGRDVIVVDTSGPVIDDAGGVWNGMSGSPVYLGDPADGRLIGAVAYRFSSGPSSVAGLTPAGDLLELLHAGATTPDGGGEQAVALQGDVRALAAERDPDATGADVGLRRLPTPLAVSGLALRSPEQVQAAVDRAGLPALVTPGGTGATGPQAEGGSAPVPGGNFAAVLSTGDVTSAAVGTTSIACAGKLVALAHEFNATGPTLMAAHGASALAIVDDPVAGPFKLANIGQPFGRLDQDRWSGVRAELGPAPAAIPVRSQVTADHGVTRAGQSGVVRPADVPLAAGLHLVGNVDSTIDRIGPGSAALETKASGTAADGTPFTFTRSNLFVSDTDIGNELAFGENYDALVALLGAGAAFETVEYTAEVTSQVTSYEIARVLVGVDGGAQAPATAADLVVARPGARLDVTVVLTGPAGEEQVPLTLTVPEGATGGTLLVTGAQPGAGAESVEATPAPGGVADVLAALAARPTNAELSVSFAPHEQAPDTAPRESVVLDRVVTGQVALPVVVEPAPFALSEVGGADRVATAAKLSAQVFDAADTVVVARADGYADALAAAPLAATLDAPILLTDPGLLRDEVGAEVARLGATEAVLLGGEDALDEPVAAGLEQQGVTVRRVAGTDRFDTASRIAGEVGGGAVYLTRGGDPDPDRGWPDALAVSALAAAQRRPILLVERDRVPDATETALDGLGVTDVTVVGGEAAIEPRVLDALDAYDVRRVAGDDRYATSLAVAELGAEAGLSAERVTLATGRSFPDALAAGPAVAAGGGLLLLLDGAEPAGSPGTYAYLETVRDTLAEVRFLGGAAAIAPSVRSAVGEALGSFAGVVSAEPEPVIPPPEPGGPEGQPSG